jgi:hypothetical protein
LELVNRRSAITTADTTNILQVKSSEQCYPLDYQISIIDVYL